MLGFVAGLHNDFGAHLTGLKGIFLGVGSSFTTAVESVVVKRYLSPSKKKAITEAGTENHPGSTAPDEELGVWQMVWMSNCLSLLFYIPLLILSGDMTTLGSFILPTNYSALTADPLTAGDATVNVATRAAVDAATTLATEQGPEFLRLAFLTGVAGFLLTIATFMQIDVTSPTTHMIVTAARGVAQSALAVLMLGEAVTAGRVASMGLILGGSALYGWAKDRWARNKDGKVGYVKVPDEEGVRRKEDDDPEKAVGEGVGVVVAGEKSGV